MADLKPTFFIIGAAKAATTSLSSLLDSHPEVAMARGKEPHFFSSSQSVFTTGWEAYINLFSHCKNEKAIGDASTSYSRIRYHPSAVKRIQRAIPDAKVIYMVRHPLERMESAYVEHLTTPKGLVPDSINDAIVKRPMILDSSRYWEVFDTYRNSFKESQIKVVWFEEYIANTVAVFQEVCRFLGVEGSFVPEMAHELVNNRHHALERMSSTRRQEISVSTVWDQQVRGWVIDQIRSDNCRFLAHFGRPRNYWGDLF